MANNTLKDNALFENATNTSIPLPTFKDIDNRIDDLGKQLIRKMLSYALGRQLEYYDEAVVRDIADKIKGAGYPMKDMVLEIGLSYPFTMKKIPLKISSKSGS